MITATPDTSQFAEFLTVFNRLCVALRDAGDDSGITQGIYFEALKDLAIRDIEQGASVLMREPGRRFFPTTAEWRAAAERAHELASDAWLRKALPAGRAEPWRHECAECEDTGWVVSLDCPGDTRCGRERKHQPHTFTRACPCRATNRTYQRHQKFGSGE
jgi:hypothetical protein